METGVLTHFDENGKSFEKMFKNILNYVGDIKDKVITGHGKIYFRNGPIYEGIFELDEINGNELGLLYFEEANGEMKSYECSYGFFDK